MDWRKGLEKDIDSVVQIQSIYTNTPKGEVASAEELLRDFGVADTLKVIHEILEKGVAMAIAMAMLERSDSIDLSIIFAYIQICL